MTRKAQARTAQAKAKKPGKKAVPAPPKEKIYHLKKAYQALPPRVQAALRKLTFMEQQFVVAYCTQARGNGTLAIQLIGKVGSYAMQASIASTMLHTLKVRSAIDEWMDAFAMTAAQVTSAVRDLAEANMGPFVKWDSTTKQLQVRVPDEPTWEAHKHWIKSIQCNEKGKVTEIQLHDRQAALREMSKILKLYSEAPIIGFHFHLTRMTDEELVRELELMEGTDDDGKERPQATRKALPPAAIPEAEAEVLDEEPDEEE